MAADKIVYVKPTKQAKVVGKPKVLVKDLAQLEGEKQLVEQLLPLEVIRLKEGQEQKVYASFLDIARAIRKAHPGVTLECVGELDTVIMYQPQQQKSKKSVEFLKVAVVCFVLFWGSMLTLMTFHNEASIPEVFANIHQLLTGEETARPLVLILSYTAGIALGIGCFFNHFGKKKLTDDPTPVQVEFVSYKKQIDDAIVDELEEQRH